jgi:hypothetical protein
MSSLGFILIAGTIGKDANFYIDPSVTNLIGVLYAEGSVMSRNASGLFYYGVPSGGVARGDIQELKNQLFWQGSIASRNTIAGAGNELAPEGIDCLPGDTSLSCAQRYDFDYLRRFTAISNNPVTPTESAIANDGSFSGGGCCGPACGGGLPAGTCQLGSLPTTIVLNGSGAIVEKDATGNKVSEVSPFYVEKDRRTEVSDLTPPGFSVSVRMETRQEIR